MTCSNNFSGQLMTITTTLTWMRYDGTPETLPGAFTRVLLLRDKHVSSIAQFIDESGRWRGPSSFYGNPRVGDAWAWIPAWWEVERAMTTTHDAPWPNAPEAV